MTEPVFTQVKLWFDDGHLVELRGTLEELNIDNDLTDIVSDGGRTSTRMLLNKTWSMKGRMRPWEFDKHGRPTSAFARPALGDGRKPDFRGPDRSVRSRRRARAKARRHHAA